MVLAQDFRLSQPTIACNPYPYYKALHDAGPISRLPDFEHPTFIVNDYQLVRVIARNPALFSSRPSPHQRYNYYPRAEEFLRNHGYGRTPHVIVNDPPRHTAYRKLLNRLLREKRVHDMRPRIAVVAHALIDDFIDDGTCDFTRAFAWKLSILIVAELLGVERSDIDQFKTWAEDWVRPLLLPLSEDQMMDCMKSIAALQHYFAVQLDDRRRQPRGDLLSDIVSAKIDLGKGPVGLRLHEELAICEVLMIAGNDTTANALSLAMLRLIERPGLAARLRGDGELIRKFIEESLRYEGSVQNNLRVAVEETALAGITVPKGALILLCWAAANRDEQQFPHADQFDIERPGNTRHVAFGQGIHTCAGASIARQELYESMDALLARMDNFRLTGAGSTDAVRRVGGIITHGPERLMIDFDKRPVSDAVAGGK